MVIYRRHWGENTRLELRLDSKTVGIYYQRTSVGGGWYDRDAQVMPLPWHKFT